MIKRKVENKNALKLHSHFEISYITYQEMINNNLTIRIELKKQKKKRIPLNKYII